MNDDKTIFACATAVGKAGVSVFRISGARAQEALTSLCASTELPLPRSAVLRTLRNPKTGAMIDKALVVFFPAPHSFTGEDVVEFYTHGGRAVMIAVIEALGQLENFRLAEPGEYTRRAFENHKMDLTEAEAVADLVHAETEAQRKQALRQMNGALGELYGDWHERLSLSLAYMEAAIDFAEDDLPPDLIDKQTAKWRDLRDEIANHLNDKHRGERLREGFSVVLLGAPNAGKSSILNALARRDAAIVSPIAGTTRDIIDVHLDINGYPVILTDTAGLRDAVPEDVIESEGIRRARVRAGQADLKIIVQDGVSWPSIDPIAKEIADQDSIVVVNKCDLIKAPKTDDALFISALTGEGIDALLNTLGHQIESRFEEAAAPPLTRARHRAALEECQGHLDRALTAPMVDQKAEDVRLAMRALGRITGRVDVEDLLDMIFKDFCIGK